MTHMERPRGYIKNLTEPERVAVLDRNEYEPLTDYPGEPTERWPARCLLCGSGVTVTLNNLVAQDDHRQWRRSLDPEFSERRQKCSHSGGNRGPRHPGHLRYEEARALMALIGEIEEPKPNSTLGRALKKVRYIAGST